MRFLISEKLGPHKYKTPEGYLVCVDAVLSRTGTQEYRRSELFGDACDDPDKTIAVDRKADEVFSDKTMASFENKAICIEHPNASVNVENHNELSVGFVRDIHQGEDNGTPVMMGTLVITDKEAVEAVESGEYKELSCGYDCDIEDERSPQQRNIRGNHVALCKQGRAGIARIVDSKVNDSLIITSERSAKFNLPGYHSGDIGKCNVWYNDLKHVNLQLDGTYKASEKSRLIWIAGKTEYAGKEGRNTGKFKVKYYIWSTFTGVTPYLDSNTISGVVVTDDDNTLKDVSNAFMDNAMKTVNDLISKMRSKGVNDDEVVDDAYTDFDSDFLTDNDTLKYEKLKREREELEEEIDRNDNNAYYNLRETHKRMEQIDKEMEKLKKNSTSLNDAKLPAKERNEISSYLNSISKYTKNDPDIIDLISPLKRKGYEIFRKNIKGWYKTSDGTMRKDYFFGINGYDNTFMISVYANEGEWKVNEVNAYFTDSVNKENSVMKKFTFVCEQYWYPSSTWEKKTKVIEAENESDAKMQLMHGGISKVRNVRLIKVSDSSVSAVGDATSINLSAGELRKGMRITSAGVYQGNNVISNVVKEKGDVVKVLFENGESESFYSFATIRVVKDSHLMKASTADSASLAIEKVAYKNALFSVLQIKGKENLFIVVSNDKYHGEKEYSGGGTIEFSLANAKRTADDYVIMANLKKKYGEKEGYKRWMSGQKDSITEDAYYEEGFSSTKGELVLVVHESIANHLKRKFGGSTSSQKVHGQKQSYWTTTNKSVYESAKKYLSNGFKDSITEDAVIYGEWQENGKWYVETNNLQTTKRELSGAGYKYIKHYVNKVNSSPFTYTVQYTKDSITEDAHLQMSDSYTVEYVKDNVTHIVEVEAKTITDAVIKAKTLSK